MKSITKILFFSALFAIILTSCLTVEKKEYTFRFTGKNSGTLSIKYYNIISVKNDTIDESEKDFQDLVSNFLNGDEIEKSYPNAMNIRKRIFEENGALCGEVTMDFETLASVKLYRHDDKGPYMLMISGPDQEKYANSNGQYGGDNMPVVFWPESARELKLTCDVTPPDQTTTSLLGQYKLKEKK